MQLAMTPEDALRALRERNSATPEVIHLARVLQSLAFDGQWPEDPAPLYLRQAFALAVSADLRSRLETALPPVEGEWA